MRAVKKQDYSKVSADFREIDAVTKLKDFFFYVQPSLKELIDKHHCIQKQVVDLKKITNQRILDGNYKSELYSNILSRYNKISYSQPQAAPEWNPISSKQALSPVVSEEQLLLTSSLPDINNISSHRQLEPMSMSLTNLQAIPETKRGSAGEMMPQIRDPHLHPAHHLARSISKSYKVEKLMKYLEPLVKTNIKSNLQRSSKD